MQYRAARMLTLMPLACALVLIAGVAVAADQDSLGASWKHQQLKFNYMGFTSHYTCDGLEDKVREVLKHFGAREGMKVRVTGCPSPNAPSPYAWVEAEFDALVPGSGDVKGQWKPIQLSANRPFFMGAGECELVDQIKPLLTTGFALRDLSYTTHCFPHQVSIGDYDVRGEVLRPAT